jgi:hypothetical protein
MVQRVIVEHRGLRLQLLHDIGHPHRGRAPHCSPSLCGSGGGRSRSLFPHALYLAAIRPAAPRCFLRAVGHEVRADRTKIMAALLCCALAASLMVAFAVRAGMSAETGAAGTATSEQQEEPRSRNEPEPGQREESQSTVTVGFVPADSEFSARLRISA